MQSTINHKKPIKNKAKDFYNRSLFARKSNQNLDALKYAFLACEAAPHNLNFKLLLTDILKDVKFQQFNPDLETMILKLLKTDKLDHQKLWMPWFSLLKANPKMFDFHQLMNTHPYNVKELRKCLEDDFFLTGISNFIVFDFKFERALGELSTLLDSNQIASKLFKRALKKYNILTEGLINNEPLPKFNIDNNITLLSKPANNIHKDVRQQYEENPYPRWVSCDVQKASSQTKNDRHQRLIAGCGTGFGTCLTALKYPNATIIAVDISLSSISYAKQKAQELGIKNVQFYQVDILEIERLNQEFDIIECSGVLHHMADPLAGWTALKKKLKQDGKMHIGLYSQIARQDVISARDIIQKEKFTATAESIKKARKFISNLPDGHIAKSVLKRRDFYSLSSCRDLIFNVQEECFTIDKIKSYLEQLNLIFEGFDLQSKSVLKKYTDCFPEDYNAMNLNNWAIFEKDNSDTFKGMYQFWCAKT